MQTTIEIDDALLSKAGEFSGQTEPTEVVRVALQAYIRRAAAKTLIALGGSQPDLELPVRERPL